MAERATAVSRGDAGPAIHVAPGVSPKLEASPKTMERTMMLVMTTEERVATPEEVRSALERGWREWHPRLLRFALHRADGDKARARDLVDDAVTSLLEPDGRKWPKDRVPSLEKVLILAMKSTRNHDLRHQASARGRTYGEEAEVDDVPDSTQDIEKKSALALRDEEVTAVIARARELLAGDKSALAVLAVLEGHERDEAVLAREARRTKMHPFDVVRNARRRMGTALQRALQEVRKS